MKRLFFFSLLALFACSSHSAFASRYMVEGRVGHFRPFSEELRDIYSEGWVNYQVDASYSPFDSCHPNWWGGFFLWGNYGYSYDSGSTRSGILDDQTSIQFYTLSLGLKYLYPMPCKTFLYGYGGLRYLFLRINNDDETVDRREHAEGLGGALGLGVLFQPCKYLVFDLFADMTTKYFKQSNFTKKNEEIPEGVDVGGVILGLGIGFRF